MSKFLISWCSEGLECVVDISEMEKDLVFSTLCGITDHKLQHVVSSVVMRARYNTQRHYEVYAITAVDGITKEDIEEMFEASPQTAADTIRQIGIKLYSDRLGKNNVVITWNV